jgi:prepilin-type N-terminal cleavage/methylation domain-containing protein
MAETRAVCYISRGGIDVGSLRVTSRRRGFTLVELIMVLVIIALIAVLSVPSIIEARKSANHSSAIGALKAFAANQSLYRESDKENDGNFDYGNLSELREVGLADQILGQGTKHGYLFQVDYSADTSKFLWYANANPALARATGDYYFAINQRGAIFFTTEGTLPLNNTDCLIPTSLLPVR